MKKILFALVAAAALLVGCQPKPVLVSKITLSQTTGSVVEGETLKLSAIVTPKEASNPELTWSSSNTSAATVTGDGTVTGVAEGTTTITAAATDGSNVKATCEITVAKKVIHVDAVGLNEHAITLKKDETAQLVGAVTPATATDQTLTWASDNTDVATVDGTGKVTAKAAGTAKITATSNDDPTKKDECVVTVVEPKPMYVQYPSCLLRTGGSITQSVFYGTIEDYANRKPASGLKWTSDNTAVATVEAAKVTAVAPGTATITGEDELGSKVTFTVTVEDKTTPVYDQYLPGVSLYDCHDGTKAWNKSTTQYSLKEGYVENTKCMGATLKQYKIAELYFDPVDASAVQNPALFVRMYIDDPTKLNTTVSGGEPLIEIRSTGEVITPEKPYPYLETDSRAYWSLNTIFSNWDSPTASAKQALHAGWNNIVLPISKATHNQLNLKKINYFRVYQMHGLPTGSYQDVEFRFDQIRIIDWTEFERCDNFAMWRDRPAQQNQYQYVNDTEGKIEGTSCIACKDVMFTAVNSYRLEMWPGLAYAMPSMFDYKDLKLQFKFYVAENSVEFFNKYVNFRVEVGCKTLVEGVWKFTPDSNDINMSVGVGGEKPYTFTAGWNTMTFNFSDYEARINGQFDIRKMDYFRIIMTPMNYDPNKEKDPDPVKYITYKLDDIRILQK